jgi:GNAT superfamily N-acetyltransferase
MQMAIPSNSFVLSPMTAADITSGLRLSQAAGWNQVAADWELLLQLSPAGSLVACLDGNVVGTVTVVSYQQALHWVGMMLVAGVYRRQGIGRALLTAALEALAGRRPVGLDATPAGIPLYTLLGFQEAYPLARYLRQPGQAIPQPEISCNPLTPGKVTSLQSCDMAVFGADRSGILSALQQRAPHLAFYAEEDRRLTGYCLGRVGRQFTQVGPLVAERLEVARALLGRALQGCAGQDVILDAPFHEPAWIRFLADLGFVEQRPFTRMVLGEFGLPADHDKQFAIAGPEMG